jgi:hypothetical protein
VVETIGKLAVDRTAIRRISVDGTSGTLLLTDGDGTPLTPGLMYNDARAGAEAARIGTIAPAESGAHGRSSALAKLLHLLARGGDTAQHALHQADWIAGRLAGRFDGSDENNALKLGYDPVTRRWPDWLDKLDVPRGFAAAGPRARRRDRCDRSGDGTPSRPLAIDQDPCRHDRWRRCLHCNPRQRSRRCGDLARHHAGGEAAGDEAGLRGGPGHLLASPGRRWLAGGASNTGGAALLTHFSAAELEAMTPQLKPAQPTGLDYYPLPKPGERFPDRRPPISRHA